MRIAGLAALLLTGACMGVSTPPSVPADMPAATNPIFEGADPAAFVDDGQLWLFPTAYQNRLHGWQRTPDGWRRGPPLLALADIGWREDGAPRHHLWAPHMFREDGRYYLYYSVGPQNPTPSRIGVAVADRIEGPFRDSGRPLLTGGDGFEAIDPAVFADPRDGRVYLLAGGSAGATLRMFELAEDRTRLGREIEVDQPPHFTEAPFLHERDGIYYLSYSHGSWQRSDYSVHYATAPAATGPWTYRGRILASAGRIKGPGHHSFFRDPGDGGWRIAYHRWEDQPGDGPYRGQRQVAVDRIDYRPDGGIAPVVMTR